MSQMEFEKLKLKDILEKYEEYINDTKLELKNIYKLYNQDEAKEREHNLKNRLYSLEVNVDKPYFARIDFDNENGLKDICYIGKVGVSNYDNEIIVVDWRAPISSLYYDSAIGKTSYKVNDDIINGNLKLKRQYNIENKQLIDFFDVDTVSNDDLLKPYLSVNADARTKNIVATIQEEQNDIIRSEFSKNLIIQGVAGSGKTTVALHRIAYLAYNYRNLIHNDQYMVIGPNKFFVNYISDMLPELDVNDVAQYDLVELAETFINQKLNLQNENEIIKKYLNGYKNELPKIKTDLEYKNIIDAYFKDYFTNNINYKSITIYDFVVIDPTTIEQYWEEVLKRDYDDLKSAINRLINLLSKFCENNKETILSKINKHIDLKIENGSDLLECRKMRTNMINKFQSNINSIIKNHFKLMFKKSTVIYDDIKNNMNKYTNNKILLQNIDNILKYEDLPALIYIEYKINGYKNFDKYRHIVIDEAQDYNTFSFIALQKIFPKASFSIYGDIAQSIYAYRSLDNWESIKNNVFKTIDIKYLNKSYRTTIEIMNEANKINKYLNLPEASAVIRHGNEVTYKKVLKTEEFIPLINELMADGKKNIAIISKDAETSNTLYLKLKNNINLTNISDKSVENINGICTISCHLCKGLEFDAVIINNVNNFDINNTLDMKLLYVAMTRALHSLVITYNDSIPRILQ